MEEQQSSFSKIREKLGLTIDAVINHRIVEFCVERYVNWTTESQRLFRRFSLIFLLLIFVSIVLLTYLTTFDQHQKIHSYDSVYRLLQEYGLKKSIAEEQIAGLQAGRGGIVSGLSVERIRQIVGRVGIEGGQLQVNAQPMDDSQEGIMSKRFELMVSKLTYPQFVQLVFVFESSGKNIHISNLKVMKRSDAKGYYQVNLSLSVVEPVFAEAQQ